MIWGMLMGLVLIGASILYVIVCALIGFFLFYRVRPLILRFRAYRWVFWNRYNRKVDFL